MVLQFFATILSILALIFAPLEAGLALSSNSSSEPNGSTAIANMGSAVAPRTLASMTVPDSAKVASDFDDFEADRGVWVGADDFSFATVTFTVEQHVAEGEDGEEITLRDSNRATIRVTSGCTELSAQGFIGIYPAMQTQRMIRVNDCKPRNLGEEAKIRLLFDASPRLYVEGDTLWVASQTQVARFDRVEKAN